MLLLRSFTSHISCRFLIFLYLNSLSIISSYTDLFPYADLSIANWPLLLHFSSFKVVWVINARYVLLKRRRPPAYAPLLKGYRSRETSSCVSAVCFWWLKCVYVRACKHFFIWISIFLMMVVCVFLQCPTSYYPLTFVNHVNICSCTHLVSLSLKLTEKNKSVCV